jgi:hypothetical protein
MWQEKTTLCVVEKMVGASRFERPTSRTPSECANQAALRSDINLLRSKVDGM